MNNKWTKEEKITEDYANRLAINICCYENRIRSVRTGTHQVCSCLNGDEKPSEVHFESCKRRLNMVREMLSTQLEVT